MYQLINSIQQNIFLVFIMKAYKNFFLVLGLEIPPTLLHVPNNLTHILFLPFIIFKQSAFFIFLLNKKNINFTLSFHLCSNHCFHFEKK